MRKLSKKERRRLALQENDYHLGGLHNDWFRITDFVRYDPATGEILSWGTMPIAALRQQEKELGHHFVEVKGEPTTHYVQDGFVVLKKAPTSELNGLELTKLPVPSKIIVMDETGDSETYDWDEPELKLEFDNPGTYRVTVKAIPYRDAVFEVIYEDPKTYHGLQKETPSLVSAIRGLAGRSNEGLPGSDRTRDNSSS